MEKRIPITVLTGFLGSGKTTLLNRILKENHGLRIAVIENEFGSVNIDSDLVEREKDGVYELSNGCLCCSVKDELLQTLVKLVQRRETFDYVLIETTGLANPSALIDTFLGHPIIQGFFALDGIVTVVDAAHVSLHLGTSIECKEQIAYADVILLNKKDLVDSSSLDSIEKEVRLLNPLASLVPSTHGDAPLNTLISIEAFDNKRVEELQLKRDEMEPGVPAHEQGIGSLAFEIFGKFDNERFQSFLKKLIKDKSEDLFRVKGVIAVDGVERLVVFQGVHSMFNFTWGKPLPENVAGRLVFIGRFLDPNKIMSGLSESLSEASRRDEDKVRARGLAPAHAPPSGAFSSLENLEKYEISPLIRRI